MTWIRFIRPRRKPRPGRLKGDALEALRWFVYERDGRRCVSCGTYLRFYSGAPDSMHLAHKRNKRMHGDSPENCVTKCETCHLVKEHNPKSVPPKDPDLTRLLEEARNQIVKADERGAA